MFPQVIKSIVSVTLNAFPIYVW